MADYSKQLDRIIEILEQGRGGRAIQAPIGQPVHSGHKGGAFMSEAREEHKMRFSDTSLDWKTVNKWITSVFGFASQAKKAAPGAPADDYLWLYTVLKTSLDNGFAQLLSEVDSSR